MKLYYAPAACSLAPHIAAREAGLDLALEKVDLGAKKTESGRDYLSINPKGAVPALELDAGDVLTENTIVLQYLADKAPESGLMVANGSLEHLLPAHSWLPSSTASNRHILGYCIRDPSLHSREWVSGGYRPHQPSF